MFDKTEFTMAGRNGQAFLVRAPDKANTLSFGIERWVDGTLDCHTHNTTPFPTGAFTHVAITFDGSSLRLFINGSEMGNGTCDAPMVDQQGRFRWGAASSGGSALFGVMDELAIYDAALSPVRIVAHYDIATAD